MKLTLLSTLLVASVALVSGRIATSDSEVHSSEDSAALKSDLYSLHRLARGAAQEGKRKRGRQHDGEANRCRYERGPWEDCDPQSNIQRRVLKLKVNQKKNARLIAEGEELPNCEPIQYATRNCKPCRYAKGEWTPCEAGIRHRVDELKETLPGATCEQRRNITKKCKPACRYNKPDWSACENGFKSRTLTLIDSDAIESSSSAAAAATSASSETSAVAANCQPTKVVRKACRGAKSANMVRDKETREKSAVSNGNGRAAAGKQQRPNKNGGGKKGGNKERRPSRKHQDDEEEDD